MEQWNSDLSYPYGPCYFAVRKRMLSDAEPPAMSNRNSGTYPKSAQHRWARVPETLTTATVLSLSIKGSLAFLTKTLGSHPRLVSC